MQQYQTILFDLDGTLTDSAPGILNSVRHACRKLQLDMPEEATLRRFLGPPLPSSFREYLHLDENDTARAVAAFREYYPEKGIFENEVYSGIPELLRDLKAAGKTVVMATSKPEIFAKRIMAHFSLEDCFDAICGASLDESRADKGEVIAYALRTAGVQDLQNVVMVGDREHDVYGAEEQGLDCVGVTYGYGSEAKLRQAGARWLARDVCELEKLLLKI